MTLAYIFTTILSILALVLYFILIKKRNIFNICLFITIIEINFGYLVLSRAINIESAIFLNIVSYLGAAFLPVYLLFSVFDVCDIKVKKLFKIVLIVISSCAFLVSTTQAWTNLYYTNVTLVIENGYSKLVKEYGPLHLVYQIYLYIFFIGIISTLVYTFIKSKHLNKKAVFISFVVFGNLAVWAIEQFMDSEFEFLAASYMFSEYALLFLYWIEEEYVNTINKLINSNKFEYQDYLLKVANQNILTSRELDVLRYMLEHKKRKEIAELLNVSENTIKTHTRHIFEKLDIESRDELFEIATKSNIN